MKSPRSACDRARRRRRLEQALRDRQHLLLDDPLRERRHEVVVDDDDAVDLLLRVELGDAVGDRLRVGVARAVAEAGPRLRRPRSAGSAASRRPSCRRRASAARRPRSRSRRSSAKASRRICALNAPASPRSPVSGRIAAVCTSRRWSSGSPRTDELARATPTISSCIRSAYGRIASIRACARRSLAAATSSIARVILRVLRTERIRRLMSWTAAIRLTKRLPRARAPARR